MGQSCLDARLSIKRFTREATRVYRLVPSDVGRPLGDIKAIIEDEGLIADAKAVLDENPQQSREQVVAYLGGNICRCTGYRPIVEAVLDAAGGTKRAGR